MKILVTGGAGFVGSHLCEKLLSQGHSVSVLDDVSTGTMANLVHLQGRPGFRLVCDSTLNPKTLEEMLEDCDFVYHLAAAVGVKLIVNDPVNTIQTNIRGTEIVLHYANKWRRPVLFTSTSEVYGKSDKEKFSEDDNMVLGPTTHSRWSYACSKAIDEFLAISYHRKNKLPVIVVRLFNTVGPRQSPQYGMVLPTFVRQALRGEPITVYGTGEQRRTFTYIDDVVFALTELPKHPASFGQVYNVGGEQEISIQSLAALVKERSGSASSIVRIPYDQAYEPGFEDMPRRVPDISKLSRAIGYRPSHSVPQIVDRVIEYFRANP